MRCGTALPDVPDGTLHHEGQDRYRRDDLVRLYAQHLASRAPTERDAATARLRRTATDRATA